MSLDHNKVLAALREVKDPITGLDIIQSKRIEDFVVDGDNVSFSIVLKSNDQEVKSAINFGCIEAINKIYPQAQVHSHLKINAENQNGGGDSLPQIKNVIAVASGKGGVGKSTIAVNLAIGLSQQGFSVGLIDADLYGPSIPTMLGIQNARPKVELLYGKHKIRPIESNGLHVMSIGFIVEPEQAVVLRGPRLGGLLRQFLQECLWPPLDFLIIDLPPGTGDVQLTLVQTIPLTGVIMVTTPQKVATIDAVKAMNMFLLPNVNVPILGVVENMSWFTPEELPNAKYYLFGQGGGKELAELSDSKLLAQIPLVQTIREAGDSGIPAILSTNALYADPFKNMIESTIEAVNYRKENFAPTKTVKVSS